MTQIQRKPNLLFSLQKKCPYCGQTALFDPRSWLQLQKGCEPCGYNFVREEGYFTGAAWVITYTFGALVGMILGAILLISFPEGNSYLIAIGTGGVAAVATLLFMPWGKSLWLFFDHFFHPLDSK